MSPEPSPSRPADPTGRAAGADAAAGTETAAGTDAGSERTGPANPAAKPTARRSVMLRLDPAVHDALTRWAADELRSVNAQVELVLRRALSEAGRAPHGAAPLPQRGRPRHP